MLFRSPEVSDDVANVSLSGAETYVLHGFNLAAREAGAGRREVRQVHRRLLKGGWSDRGERGPRLGLPEAMHEQVRAWADEDRADLAGVDVDLYGSLDDLNVTMVSAGSSPGPEAVAEAAGAALDILRRGSTAPLDVGDDED